MEFSLVLPLFIAIVAGVIALGWTQHSVATMRYALEGAARRLMLNPAMTESEVQALVRESLATPGDPNVTVTIQITTGGNAKIAYITGRYQNVLTAPFLRDIPITYSSTVAAALPMV